MSFYVCSDLHGEGKLWDKIKEFLKPTDNLICLGDCIDRGLDGWRILKEMLLDERVHLLKGNHEDMMANFFINKSQYDYSLWMYNGGEPTLRAFDKEENKKEWIKKINDLPQYMNITINGKNFRMSHAGYNPLYNPEDLIKYDDLLWDRSHFTYPIKEKNTIIVHGHTPIPYLPFLKNEENIEAPYWYADNTKVDIDCGCFISDMTVLLNLDNFQAISITND